MIDDLQDALVGWLLTLVAIAAIVAGMTHPRLPMVARTGVLGCGSMLLAVAEIGRRTDCSRRIQQQQERNTAVTAENSSVTGEGV